MSEENKFKAVHWWMRLTTDEQDELTQEYYSNAAKEVINEHYDTSIDPIRVIYNGEMRKKKLGTI